MYFVYITKKFLNNFFTILIGISLLYVIVDFSFSFKNLSNSSNLQILYIFYMFIYAIFLVYPISLVFAFLYTLNQMIKFNELVSFYSLGFSPYKLLKPILISSILIFLFIASLQFTKLAYINEYATSIKKHQKLKTKDIFLKFNDNIVYIKELNPIFKKAYFMYVFKIQNKHLTKIIFSKEAFFKKNEWISKDAKIIEISDNKWIEYKKNIHFLKNFKPKILSNLKKLNNISFYDAYLAIKYFKDIDLNKILTIVFYKIFTPLTMIFLIVFLFTLSPIHMRISNISLFMIKSIFLTIIFWGSELLLLKFAKQGVISYYVLSIPFFVVLIINFLRRRYEF